MPSLRLPGIGSGLDTDSIISQLMALEKRPVTLLQQKSDTLTTQANAWRDVNSRLLNLQNRLADLRNNSIWDARKATLGDPSVATVTVSSSAALGTHSITTAMPQGTRWLSVRNIANPDAALNRTGTIRINSSGANNGKTIDIVGTDTLRSIVSKINADPTLGLTAELVQVGTSYRLQVTSAAGAANDFTLSDQSGTVASYLQILSSGGNAGVKLQTASDYQLTIDGTTTTSTTNVFKNVLPGVDVTVLKATTAPVVMTVDRDADKAVKAVKEFVDQYNSVVDFLDSQTSYDAKTKKAGTLFGESLVRSIQGALDQRLTSPVSAVADEYELLSQVGVTMEKFSSGGNLSRKLTFDESKFRAALAANPNAVKDLFTLNSGSNKGIAVRTEEWLKDYTSTGGLVLSQAASLDKTISQVKDQIDRWNTQILPIKEERLRRQFNALDVAMSQIQSQGQWLSQQILSLPTVHK
jgi:flagellar hook-associated protein 2